MARPVALAGESVVVMQVDGMVRNSTGADWGLWLAHSALDWLLLRGLPKMICLNLGCGSKDGQPVHAMFRDL